MTTGISLKKTRKKKTTGKLTTQSSDDTKKKNLIPLSFKKGVILVGFICSIILFLSFLVLKDLPSTTHIADTTFPQSTKIYDKNGKLLYTIYTIKNRSFVPLAKIPKHLQHATIAIEDKDFYQHGAIDIRGIARALFFTLFKGQVQGGSTITQQLVKNSILTPERTLTRKIKEVILAFTVEIIYKKDKILEMYLNHVPYGGTAWGVQAASEVYFDKPVEKLNLAESALLAGMPSAPSLYSPFGARPELAKKRQREVLRKMREQEYIREDEEKEALSTPLAFSKVPDKIRAPHFVFYVKELLVQKYGEKMAEQGGLHVTTSLDLDLQDFVQATVATEVAQLKEYNVSNGATLITNPATGEILAMVGSQNYFDVENDGNVNITISERQPGSAIKPINYAVGLLKGITPATPFVDKSVCFPNPQGKPYCPVNYDGKFHGGVQMRFALGSSLNIPAVKMLKFNGVEDMMATASAMGIKTFKDPHRYGLSLTLGGGEVTMLDMAEAFGVFANSGYRIPLHPILKVTDASGKVLEEYNPPKSPILGKKVLPSEVTFLISHILLDNNARSLAFGEYSPLRIENYPISVKTGTTNDFRDNWTIGYTKSSVVVVWVGNNNNAPMRGLISGVTGAAPIWNTILKHLVTKNPPQWPEQPKGIVGKTVCATSGLLPPPEGTPDRCPVRFEYFIKGTEPKQVDPGRRKVRIHKTTGDLAKDGQVEDVEERDEIVVTDVLGDSYCLSCPHPEQQPN